LLDADRQYFSTPPWRHFAAEALKQPLVGHLFIRLSCS
jgi:hypothetical protein